MKRQRKKTDSSEYIFLVNLTSDYVNILCNNKTKLSL